MDIFTDIAKRMDSDKLESLARFRAAAKANKSLPAGIYELPHGFLTGVGFSDDLRALYVLSPLGMRVAMAAEKLAAEAMSPEEKIADMRRRLADAGFDSSFDGAVLSVTKESA
jgi:hypothetical protein